MARYGQERDARTAVHGDEVRLAAADEHDLGARLVKGFGANGNEAFHVVLPPRVGNQDMAATRTTYHAPLPTERDQLASQRGHESNARRSKSGLRTE
jgi:hypothetical protein